METRPYQDECIEAVREKIRAGAKRVLVVAPTGSGKTVIASRMIQSAHAKGSRSLFLAHRKELIAQTVDKLGRFGVRAGVIQADARMQLHLPVQVASVQTLIRRPHAVQDVKLVFVDEAHHHTEKNLYGRILQWYPNAIVVGLTATPWRLDGQGLADVYEESVLAASPAQLRDMGFLVQAAGWAFIPVSTRAAKVKGGDFVGATLEAAALEAKVVGNVVGEWKQRAGGGRTVLFACTIAHSQAMARAFCAAGVAAEHLDGETPAAERAGILGRIRSGATRVLCNVNVATEGWDCPELECVLLCRPTLSTSLYLQMVGRVLRTCEGKSLARIHDHANCVRTHGHPYAERDYSPKHSANVDRKSADDRASLRDRKCPQCEALLVGLQCPACGFSMPVPVVEHVEGEAVPLQENAAWQKAMAEESERKKLASRFRLLSEREKRDTFFRFVQRCGGNVRQATGRYRWYSGETEWPSRDWQAEAREATA